MPVVAHAEGTQEAEVGTEHFLSDVAVYGVFLMQVDCAQMLGDDEPEGEGEGDEADVLILRCYRKVLAGGALSLIEEKTIVGAQHVAVQMLDRPVSNDHSDPQALRFSLQQSAGAPRSFDWKILRHI